MPKHAKLKGMPKSSKGDKFLVIDTGADYAVYPMKKKRKSSKKKRK